MCVCVCLFVCGHILGYDGILHFFIFFYTRRVMYCGLTVWPHIHCYTDFFDHIHTLETVWRLYTCLWAHTMCTWTHYACKCRASWQVLALFLSVRALCDGGLTVVVHSEPLEHIFRTQMWLLLTMHVRQPSDGRTLACVPFLKRPHAHLTQELITRWFRQVHGPLSLSLGTCIHYALYVN